MFGLNNLKQQQQEREEKSVVYGIEGDECERFGSLLSLF